MYSSGFYCLLEAKATSFKFLKFGPTSCFIKEIYTDVRQELLLSFCYVAQDDSW